MLANVFITPHCSRICTSVVASTAQPAFSFIWRCVCVPGRRSLDERITRTGVVLMSHHTGHRPTSSASRDNAVKSLEYCHALSPVNSDSWDSTVVYGWISDKVRMRRCVLSSSSTGIWRLDGKITSMSLVSTQSVPHAKKIYRTMCNRWNDCWKCVIPLWNIPFYSPPFSPMVNVRSRHPNASPFLLFSSCKVSFGQYSKVLEMIEGHNPYGVFLR